MGKDIASELLSAGLATVSELKSSLAVHLPHYQIYLDAEKRLL